MGRLGDEPFSVEQEQPLAVSAHLERPLERRKEPQPSSPAAYPPLAESSGPR